MQNNNHLKEQSIRDNSEREEHMKTKVGISAKIPMRLFPMLLVAGSLLIAALMALRPFPAEARGLYGPAASPDQMMERLKERLDLTAEQEEAIRPIMEEKIQKHKELMEKSGTDREALRTGMQKLRESTDMKLGEILTDGQKGKYLELRQERDKWLHMGRQHRRGMHGAAKKSPEQIVSRLRESLELNDAQVAEIQPIIRESIEQRREIFNKYKERDSGISLSMKDEMKALSERTDERLSKILTDEQREKFLNLKKERRGRMHKHMRPPEAGGY